ncbi:dipeptidyl-peptidase precursor [Tenacibaculum maritimum]|uniref:S9 family peptidase n=1 Tax=Tenacibaculum maritimum TaxID=107401 RepID=UPI0012E512B3|nr:S9 family peptidase [Tenacibaculum maritimum]CAA0248655.1 dipeptidyl-peptidase precursor [Tenacibaculum maritimum]CAA0254782.1 dipeptidyl-peptidase precursor [Tenacibaculum maritimum]
MKKLLILTSLALFISCKQGRETTQSNSATTKDITLKEIWDGTFSEESMNALNSMNGNYYSLLNYDPTEKYTTVDKYSYETLKKVAIIVDSRKLKGLPNFSSYHFNNNETKLILGTNFKEVYRHSFKGTYYVYDIDSKKLSLIGKNIQEPTFSPDSKKVAYTQNNNLFIKDLKTNKITRVTKDGKNNFIINGTTDWVYEEEFAFVKAFGWNKESNYIAFLRFDERNVPEFSMDVYAKTLYPNQQVFKYPKAGEKNAVVSLHLFNVKTGRTRQVNVGEYEYIPRIQWTNDSNVLSVTTLNRHQNDLKLYFVDAENGNAKVILNEKDEAYVDIQDNLTFLEDHSFIWTSEKDGFNHIYHYDHKGKLKKQVTQGDWEVTSYYGFDKNINTIYYQSVENGAINRNVYSIKLDGSNKKLISREYGTNNAAFSKNKNYFINTFSDANTPRIYALYKANGELVKIIKENKKLQEKIAGYKISPKEFSTIEVNGNSLNMWMIKPIDFDAGKRYPLLMFQYSGPGSQQVRNVWNSSNDYWHNMLAQRGYIVVCVDGRGTGLKGRDFKKVTQKELGKYEVEDQIAVAKKMAERSYVDPENIGIWGWSYGGFMSSNCLLKGNDTFTMAIAVAPVTSWRFYDSVYTERYMQTPQENASGYDDNSPINHVEKLKGDYLLIHGTGDDNVHVQNAMQMANALIAANKPFDFFVYPDKAHGIYKGEHTRLHLYTKMTKFIENHLTKK